MNESAETKCRARDGGGSSFHVDYAINDEHEETENLTHRAAVIADDIENRGDTETGWTCDLSNEENGFIRLFVNEDDMGWAINHQITAETAEQLSDMFARAAEAARIQMAVKAEKLEAEFKAAEEMAARIKAQQPDLFD